MKVKKYANVFYQQRFAYIGGVETYEFETLYKYAKLGYELDLFYGSSPSPEQIKRIAEVIGEDHIHKYNGETIYCERAFVNYDMYGFIENVYADEIINVNHANFYIQDNFPIHDHKKITKKIGVSDVVSKAYKKRCGQKIETCYNPISLREHDRDRVLTLISACRLTAEKGGKRMADLMRLLDEAKIKYYWHIFTDNDKRIGGDNVCYHKPTLEIRPYINNADYVVQLSDSEGYCYTVLEALCLGTPVIVSDIEIFKEMGVVNGKNGWILPLDMKDVPIKQIYEKQLKGFKYQPKEDNYEKYLTKNKSSMIDLKHTQVRILKPFHDLIAKVHYVPYEQYVVQMINIDGRRNLPIGTIVEMETQRAKELSKLKYVEVIRGRKK